MSRALDLVFGIEDAAAPNAVEDLVDEHEAPQEAENGEENEEKAEQQKKRWKGPSAYIKVFEDPSRYTLTRLLQRNPGQWHPLTSMEKFKKELYKPDALLKSAEVLCSQSAMDLLSLACDDQPSTDEEAMEEGDILIQPTSTKTQQPDVIDLTLDSDDEQDTKTSSQIMIQCASSADTFFFCDDDTKMTLEEALARLSAEHLQTLAKDFKCYKPKSTKDAVVTALLGHARGQAILHVTPDGKGKGKANTKKGDGMKQTTLFGSGFVQKRTQEQLLLKKAREKLGFCLKINPVFDKLTARLNIIYYRRRVATELPAKPFTPSLLTVFKKRAYPQYTHNRSVIWPTRNDFLEYEKALHLQFLMSEAEIADVEEAKAVTSTPQKQKKAAAKKAEEENGESKAARRSRLVLGIFKRENVEQVWDACCAAEDAKAVGERRPELERFQCGHILTRLMSKAAGACGPLKQYEEEYRLLQKLLGQRFWRRGKRADWYTRRALITECYLAKTVPKKPDRAILRQALDGIVDALEDEDTHIVARPELVRRYQKLEKSLRIPERQRCKMDRELRQPRPVEYAGRRVYTTQAASPSSSKPEASSPNSDKENTSGDNANPDGMPINAELTSYFRKVAPHDPEKEEAAMLIANAALKAHWKWKGKSKWRGEGGGEVIVEELALQYYAKRGYKGFHAETSILTTIFALLFWDIIFADIPGAFETKFQAGPLDLAEDSFYYARKGLIEQRVKDIEAGHARRLVEKHDKMYRKRNTLCVGVRWDVCPPEDLLEAVECLKTETLVSICRLFCEDYAARARGVPDLFVWDYEKRECMFVEVKGPGDRASETQKLWFDTLLNAKADVEICRIVELTFKGVNSNKRKRENQRKAGEKAQAAREVSATGNDEEEYEPGYNDDDDDEMVEMKPPRTRRSRSATLVAVDDSEEEGQARASSPDIPLNEGKETGVKRKKPRTM
ncbi:hypothetical protein V5O48_007490 [Marasmius crinis-equi]|uniref:Fanconi-associated nuclease n=1 Tax=Marasmius crinis-equi TaxID=585013 RepID=A0ABR3FGS6_9AGAR